jgi:hypothetical protein
MGKTYRNFADSDRQRRSKPNKYADLAIDKHRRHIYNEASEEDLDADDEQQVHEVYTQPIQRK